MLLRVFSPLYKAIRWHVVLTKEAKLWQAKWRDAGCASGLRARCRFRLVREAAGCAKVQKWGKKVGGA